MNIKFLKSFSMIEIMLVLVVSCVLMVAAFPLVNLKMKMDSYDLPSIACIKADAGNITSANCEKSINSCKYNIGKACKTLFFLADHGYGNATVGEQADARKVIKEVCDNDGSDACKYFIEDCRKDSSFCDIGSSDYDLHYYLSLPTDDPNIGRITIADIAKAFYDQNYANVVTEVNNACCNPDFNTACDIKGETSCPYDIRFTGRVVEDYSGSSLCSAGDVNNDGYDDLLIGASSADGGGGSSGEVYLIFGRSEENWITLGGESGNFSLLNMSWANSTVRFIGRAVGDALGSSVSSAGDVNNDGYDDLLFGASSADGGGDKSGEAYLIFGRSNADWSTLTGGTGDFSLLNMSWANRTVRFIGRDIDDWMGLSLSSTGDVNNDGYDDFLLGAYRADTGGDIAGDEYLILGRSTADWGTLAGAGDFNLDNMSWANRTVRFVGRLTLDALGRYTGTAGDVNNDGYDDVFLSAYAADGGGVNSGEVYLILGRSTADWGTLVGTGDFNLDFTSWANSTVRFIGRVTFDYAGISINSAGDVNNDGYDDLLIGASSADGGGDASGETYLILGRSTADWGTLAGAGNFNLDNLSWANSTVRFNGRVVSDSSGVKVSSAGDVNNDGYDDLLIGAYFADGGGVASGEVYLILGRSTADWGTLTGGTGVFNLLDMSSANSTMRFIGRVAGDKIGEAVSSAGDVNNDGYDDLLFSASYSDSAGSNMGETYLIKGRGSMGGDYFCNATWP